MAEFEKVEELYPNSSWVVEARARIGELEDHLTLDSFRKARFYFGRKSYTSTISRLQEIVAKNPDYENIDEVYYYLGMAFLKGGQAEVGRVHLQKVVVEYPDSRFAKKAASGVAKARATIAAAPSPPAVP